MTFRIGQKVCCIDDLGFEYPYGEKLPVRGQIYTIREIDNMPGEECALRFEELRNPRGYYLDMNGEACFLTWRFRPVIETDISAITSMLVKPSVKKVEHAA